MGELPASVLGVIKCGSYLVYCNGREHVVFIDQGVPVDDARVVVEHSDNALVVKKPANCSREDCHQRDASRVVMQRLRDWATGLD